MNFMNMRDTLRKKIVSFRESPSTSNLRNENATRQPPAVSHLAPFLSSSGVLADGEGEEGRPLHSLVVVG
jgi:hypothetical protein